MRRRWVFIPKLGKLRIPLLRVSSARSLLGVREKITDDAKIEEEDPVEIRTDFGLKKDAHLRRKRERCDINGFAFLGIVDAVYNATISFPSPA